MSTWKTVPISPVQEAEIQRFATEIAASQAGTIEADDFRRFRLENGVYGIRGTTDTFMVRVKIPLGALTVDQLEAMADLAEQFTPLRIAHVTTRQNLQFHNVPLTQLPAVLRLIASAGLTTREACGNTVRTVTACPFAGVAADEAFDVTPYAIATTAYFLRNPICQNMPRKFKIAFEGCPADHIRLGIHDFGAQAVVQNGQRGFRVVVGGGLGSLPLSAQLLEEFTPEELLLPTIEAVVRLFDRHGNRKDRARARIKFIIKDWGIEEFSKQALAERQSILITRSGASDWTIPASTETAPSRPATSPLPAPSSAAYQRWLLTNCSSQKQNGFKAVHVRCPLGDISVAQMRGIAGIAHRYGGGHIRASIRQNLVLRWIPATHLPNVFADLASIGLAAAEAEHIADITRCPGADTCQLAITHSRGLAVALDELFTNGLTSDPALQDLNIKISGCPNACGQHHIADIGFFGSSRTIDGHQVAHYRMMLGGKTEAGRAEFAMPVATLPAKRISEALRKLLTQYRDTRGAEESFYDYIRRFGTAHLKQMLDEFTTLPAYSERPDLYGDLGHEGEFKVQISRPVVPSVKPK